MRRQLDEMALILKKHKISLPTSTRKDDSKKEKMKNTKGKAVH